MKRILILTLTALMFSLCGIQAEAKGNKIDELKIKRLISKMDKYSNAHNIKKLKTLYSPDFKSWDGFNFDEFFSLVETTFNSYSNVQYKVKTKKIEIDGNNAQVALFDRTTGTLASTGENGLNFGDLSGDCDYIAYLKKVGGKWLFTGDYVISEKTSLKYGDARDIKMEINAPEKVNLGDEYSIILQMERPKDLFVIAALAREEIALPPIRAEEIFRKVSSEGDLERIVYANKEGKNEYAVASVGLTRVQVDEDLSSIKFQMSGLAFLMSRVNANPPAEMTVNAVPTAEAKDVRTFKDKEEPAPEVKADKEEPIEKPVEKAAEEPLKEPAAVQ